MGKRGHYGIRLPNCKCPTCAALHVHCFKQEVVLPSIETWPKPSWATQRKPKPPRPHPGSMGPYTLLYTPSPPCLVTCTRAAAQDKLPSKESLEAGWGFGFRFSGFGFRVSVLLLVQGWWCALSRCCSKVLVCALFCRCGGEGGGGEGEGAGGEGGAGEEG